MDGLIIYTITFSCLFRIYVHRKTSWNLALLEYAFSPHLFRLWLPRLHFHGQFHMFKFIVRLDIA